MAVARVTKVTASSPKVLGGRRLSRPGSAPARRCGESPASEVIAQKAKVEGGKIVEYRLT